MAKRLNNIINIFEVINLIINITVRIETHLYTVVNAKTVPPSSASYSTLN
jgi:hypothetical protein